MSLITRCPACETHFKVVPDQLRISDGWVRCGQCDEVFDASLHLLPDKPVLDALTPVAEVHEPEPETAPVLEPELESEADFETADLAEPPWQLPVNDLHLPLTVDPEVVEQEVAPVIPNEIEPEAPIEDDDIAETQFLPYVSSLPEPALPLSEPATAELDRQADLRDVSFLRSKISAAPERSAFWRGGLVVLSTALMLSLLTQIAIQERDQIVSLMPSLKPALQVLCVPFRCTLSPMRKIESIIIESASFTKMRGDTYRLNFTVKNSASTALAVPAIELTLTDTRDQPVVRRVFLATEIGVKLRELAAGSEWPASIAIEVKGGAAAEPVAGYRVVAFYP